ILIPGRRIPRTFCKNDGKGCLSTPLEQGAFRTGRRAAYWLPVSQLADMLTETLQEEIWQWVAAVPPGKVASYGQIAALAGHPRHSRYVGKVLRELPPGSTLPWHRILRAS